MSQKEQIWELYLRKREALYQYGIENGLIHCYEKELIDELRHTYYGGISASIIILSLLC